jgi:hypothetical protein
MSHVQPAALRDDWSLRHAAPLISPAHSYKGYLAGIFSSALCNGRKWTESWAAQIASALAWVHVTLLLGYTREDTMRAMHKGLHRAYSDSAHTVQGTVKAVYCMRYSMPAKKCIILAKVQSWLKEKAAWRGGEYISCVGPQNAVLHSYSPVWNGDFTALEVMRGGCCAQADCVCVSPR